MKPHNVAIITFSLFAGAALAATLFIQSKMGDDTSKSQWESTINDLCDHSSTAHIRTLRYDSYARQAAVDNIPSHEQLFLALACSERIHEQLCIRAIQLFGGEYVAPNNYTTLSTSTKENLARALASLRNAHNASQGEATTRAIESGNRYVARILIWIDGTNRRHIELLEESYNRSNYASDKAGYLVCSKCGNIYHSANYDVYCPFCQTHHTDFKRFEQR